jgi:hypothetical protein
MCYVPVSHSLSSLGMAWCPWSAPVSLDQLQRFTLVLRTLLSLSLGFLASSAGLSVRSEGKPL